MAVTLIRKEQLVNLALVNADVAAGAAIATSKLADSANFILRTGAVAFTADQSHGSFKITNLGAPVSANDAARLIDVQNASAGITGKDAVRVTTIANITLSAPQTIDGVAVVAGDRVLVKNQTLPAENGIYVVAAGAWARSVDANSAALLKSGSFAFVCEGTTNADTGWLLSTDGAMTMGTTPLTFVQFSGGATTLAGAGLTKTGNTFDVVSASATRIVVSADSIDLYAVVAGASIGAATGASVPYLTYDNYGRITAGASRNITASDISAQASAAILTSLSNLATVGFLVQSVTGTAVARTITGTANNITVSNGTGAAGDPVINLATVAGMTAATFGAAATAKVCTVSTDTFGRITAITEHDMTCALIGAQPTHAMITSLIADVTLGILCLTAANTITSRSLVQGTGITITNVAGTSGDITIAQVAGVCTVGTYTSVTVDTYGRVTSGTNPTVNVLASSFVTRETPTGLINGSNPTFNLANTPIAGTEEVYLNGVQLDSGAGNDYTIATATITMLTGAIPQTGDKLKVTYRK